LQGVSEIERIAKYLEDMEKKCDLEPEEHKPNFGLVQVVYDWAQGKVTLFTEF
jgi:hypothetical protein